MRWLKVVTGVAGVLVLLTIILVWRLVPPSSAPYASAAAQAADLQLTLGAASVHLNRQEKSWQVQTSSGLLPADPERVNILLESLKEVTVEDVISDRADRLSDFELTDSSGTRVHIRDARGKTLADGMFGKQAPDFSHIYFRFMDQPVVYLARGIFRGEVDPGTPASWAKVDRSTASPSATPLHR